MTFGEKCLKFRARFSLTQNDLAKIFEVTPLMISRYENDYAKPRGANKMRFEEIIEKAEVNFK